MNSIVLFRLQLGFLLGESGWKIYSPPLFKRMRYYSLSDVWKRQGRWEPAKDCSSETPGSLVHLFLYYKWKKEGLCRCLSIFPALFNKSRGISLLGYEFVSSWTFICLDYCVFRKEVCSALSWVHVSATEFLLIIITKFALSVRKKYIELKNLKSVKNKL